MRKALAVIAVLVATTGCYHATVVTGRTPSGDPIRDPWASSWLGGLVPPDTVDTAAACPSGVARVETKHSFLNMLVQMVTFSIYTPMTIEVHCAAAGSADAGALTVPAGASNQAAARVLDEAAQRAAESGREVFVRFQ